MQNQTRFIFKQGFIYGIGNILVKLSGVILIPLYLKYINETEFGIVTLFETIFQFTLIFSGFGVKSGFMRWYHEKDDRSVQKSLFFTSWSFNFMTSFLSVGLIGSLILIFSKEIFHFNLSDRTIYYFIGATFCRLLLDLPFYLLKIEQRAAAQTGWLVLNIVLILGATYYFLGIRNMGLEGIYLAQFVANLLTFLSLVPLIINNSLPRFDSRLLKAILSFGFPLAISNVLTTVLTLSDRHIINQYQNLSEVAGYSMAFKVSNLIQMVVVASFITGYTSYYYKTLHEKDNKLFFQRILRYFIVLLAFGGLGIVLFSPEIIYIVSAGSYFFQSSVILVPVLIIGIMFSGLRQLFALPLNKHKQTRKISYVLVITAVVNVGGNFLLVPVLGKLGASLSTVVAQLISMVWFIHATRQLEGFSFAGGRNLILLLVWGLLVYAGVQAFALPLVPGWGIKVLLLLCFVGVMFLTGHINKDELREVKSVYKKLRR